ASSASRREPCRALVLSNSSYWRPFLGYLPLGPVFEEQPSSLIYPEGLTEGKVTLSCQARANPAAAYRWLVNGTAVPLNLDRYSLVAGTLVISSPDPIRDTGSYQCLAINRCGTIISRAANLKFGYLHDFPPDGRSPQTINEGQGTFLACQPPPHYPALSYRWFLNEFPNFIRKDDGRWFVSQVTGNLYLAKADPNDTANYFCFTTINMEVSTKSTFSKANQLTVVPDAPTIKVRFLADTYALAGHTTQLECFAYGNPVPKVRWRKVDGLMPSKAGPTVEGPTLTLPELSFDDEGIYECEAYNSEGRDTYQGRINVQAQPEWLQVMTDSEVEISSDLQWSCVAAGKPRPSVRWLRNGQPLSTQDRVEVNGVHLRIINLALEDSGMYQCVAENKHGTIYSTAELRVQVQAPDFRLNPVRKLIPAARGGQVMIDCRPRAAPKPSLFWSRGTELLTNSSRITVTPDGILWIYNISRADEGKYTCFAENYLGKANSTGHLSVRGTQPNNSAISNKQPHKENTGDLLIVRAQLSQAGSYVCTAQTVVDSAAASAKLVVRGPPGPPGGLLVKNVAETSVELRWSRGYDNHSPIGKYVIMGRSPLSSEWRKMRTGVSLTPERKYSCCASSNNKKHSNNTMITQMQQNDFIKKDASSWTEVRVPRVESSRYVHYNSSLAAYTPFEVKIKAYNRKGEGPFSQVAVVHSAEEEPTVGPSSINATALSAFEIQVSWEPVQQLSANGILRGYEIRYWRQHEREAAADRVRTAGLEPTARVSGLRPSTRYHVAVLAYNSAGTGPPSPRTAVTTRKPPPNRPPGSVSWKAHGSRVTVRWDQVTAMHNESAILGYKVRTGMMVQKDASSTLSCPHAHLLSGLALLIFAVVSGL
uniref:Contactin-2 n=1 Tax=Neolamprologus brichardi TaxID=32507 RepID=A0A3Q4N4V3_NEOBR